MEARLRILRPDWDHVDFTRTMAESFLRSRAPGSFLVRHGPSDAMFVYSPLFFIAPLHEHFIMNHFNPLTIIILTIHHLFFFSILFAGWW